MAVKGLFTRRSTDLATPQAGRRAPRSGDLESTDALGRASEAVAMFFGRPLFLAIMVVFVAVWIIINTLTPWRFDPYTFTFLTLLLSIQASFSSPLILLAQTRQVERDRVQNEQDRIRAERNVADTEYIARELVDVRLGSAELLKEVQRLRKQVGELNDRLTGDDSSDDRTRRDAPR
ncbi:DUF1003 domain-containing protein [Mycetocola reblochoni]|nr:DUF1003 domain-containing protein [Mycetocola reblochoni]SJN37620.1 PROBABLE MEMBRANE PROTEIN [Mycetocola reblochoni REB411]